MKRKHKLYKKLLLALASLVVILSVVTPIAAGKTEVEAHEQEDPIKTELEQRREVWAHALEWCESRGNREAINGRDVDGTPSYYSLQFKPGTFLGYGVKYGLIPEGTSIAEVMLLMEDYDLTRAILWQMFDDEDVNWYNEFPDCVRNKIGPPPR